MGYKCQYDGEDGCRNCEHSRKVGNWITAGRSATCIECQQADGCPISYGLSYPSRSGACELCNFIPKESEETMSKKEEEKQLAVTGLEIKKGMENDVYESGAFRDKKTVDKGRFDLLPWDAIWELAIHCAKGAEVYGERNCEKGVPQHSLIDSATRHLACYQLGMDDENHLAAAMWNIAFAIYNEMNNPEMQDIPARQGKTCLYRK